ncbi:MAG: hypothetical protein HDT23_00265 [Ruminococcus sp.]|nr:hypothetical protein [Ruminococcus sp.]
MSKFTQIRPDTFESIQINAGILLTDFEPETGEYQKTAIIGATTGGNSFSATPEFSDFGEDIDNVPSNTRQMKRITSYTVTLSGSFVTIDGITAQKLCSAADLSADNSHIIPRTALVDDDFHDIWLVGDYSAKNGGFVAIHVKNALSTGGFQWQSSKDGKGTFSYEFTGHYDLENIDEPPFEIFIKSPKTDAEFVQNSSEY